MTRTLRFPAILLSAAFIAAACSGGGGGSSSAPAASEPGASASGGASGGPVTSGAAGEINVLSLWGGSEEEAFKKVLADFTAKTGWGVKYEADRQTYSTTLQSRITGGNPPDIAIIPGIGFLRRFAKDGSLKKISDLGVDASTLTQDYPEGFLAAGTVDGELYALPAKYNNKGTMWFRPDVYKAASVDKPTTWDDYKAMLEKTKDKPGAMALGAKDDWNLTDWFESIYIRQAGVDAYDKLFSKDGDWTDPSVTTAVKSMTDVLNDTNVEGGIKAALGRGFVDGIAQAFSATPKADMYYEGGFVGGIITGQVNKAAKLGTDADWFDFPSINGNKGVTIGGDVIAAFTTKPGVKEFMEYMATAEAGAVWAGTGAIISPVKGVADSVYPNDQTKREAAQVANATAVRFDGSDLLPGGGPNLGAELQKAIQGQTVDWASFQTQIQTAWTNE